MDKPIHVLHVLGGVGLGGAESRIMDLYRQMNREEIQFDFLVHDFTVRNGFREARRDESTEKQRGKTDERVRKPQFYDEEIQAMGGHIYVLPKFKGYNYLAYRRAVRDFFAAHREFRVVQGHMTSTAGIYLPIAKKAGVPVVAAHARNAGVVKGLKGLATRFFRRGLAGKADYCFACSALAGQDVFGGEAMNTGRVKIIHNAIDVERFTYDEKVRQEVRAQLGISDELVLGHVGRFEYQKNHPYLLDVFAAVCKERQGARLLLLGEGEDRAAMEEKCRQLNISDRVRFLGNRRDAERFYQAMDLFLLPSFFEGLPGVLVEAQAAGLRCMVSDTVTREAQATDLVTYLSIGEPPVRWAAEIIKQADYERRNTAQELRTAGFDVRTQAEGYRRFYLGESMVL
ncbi:MAG: glycosyltransferase family 1 protein [Lachnospiraceae bacterium]|jgi:glycosyltransferase involved in cell wall biosynthesis|nr:glycosyltransferase family 1 protein [Lachnospiraceae bacterium]